MNEFNLEMRYYFGIKRKLQEENWDGFSGFYTGLQSNIARTGEYGRSTFSQTPPMIIGYQKKFGKHGYVDINIDLPKSYGRYGAGGRGKVTVGLSF